MNSFSPTFAKGFPNFLYLPVNAVERVLVYADLPPEGDTVTAKDPPESWPDRGAISFTDVEMAYREGLPLVLKGVTFNINPGEKVGTASFPFVISMILSS